MPKLLSVPTVAAALSACAALVLAQEAPPARENLASATATSETPTNEPKPAEPGADEKPKSGPAAPLAPLPGGETAPAPTPKPRHRSFFEWLFGSHHKETPAISANPTPTPRRAAHRPSGAPEPTPKATPTPKKTDHAVHSPKPETTPKPDRVGITPKPEKEKPTPTPKSEPSDIYPATPATPAPHRTPKPKATPTPRPISIAPSVNKPPVEPPADADADAKEQYRFELAKSKALEDAHIKSLKDKADQAGTDEESRAALRTYYKALIEKIKKVDPAVSERADQLERALLKRVSE
jgi:hypothetical protein